MKTIIDAKLKEFDEKFCPNGVLLVSDDMDGLPELKAHITSTIRECLEGEVKRIQIKIDTCFQTTGKDIYLDTIGKAYHKALIDERDHYKQIIKSL